MANDGDQSRRYERLCAEHDDYGKAIRDLMTTLDRMLGLALIIFGVGASLGRSGPSRDLLVVLLPFGLYVVAAYTLWLVGEVVAMGTYKAYLEDEIQEYLKTEGGYATWERHIVPIRRLPVPQIFAFGLYAGGIGAANYFSWTRLGELGSRSPNPLDSWLVDSLRCLMVVGGLVLLYATYDANLRTAKRVEKVIQTNHM